MKKRKNTRSKANDVLVVLICLCGAAVGLYLFWNDLNRSLSKLNEEPIATITYKYRIAQRKFIDRLIWDRLQQNTPIYNGDTVRTSSQAEATIQFLDNNIMVLGENSIAQVFLDDAGNTEVDFSGGGIRIDSTTAQSGLKLRAGNTTVKVQSGSELAAESPFSETNEISASSKPLTLQVLRGTASLSNTLGNIQQSITTGNAVSIDRQGITSQAILTVTAPFANAKLLNMGAEKVSVNFNWLEHNLPEKSTVVLETATDKDFRNLVEQIALSGLNELTIDIPTGTTYWRLYAAVNAEIVPESIATGRIQVLDTPKPELIVPATQDVFSYRTKKPVLRFVWNGNEYASSYLIEIADNPEMHNPVFSQQTQHTSSIISSLSAGNWYWQVTPFYAINNIGAGASSKVSSFTIEQRGILQPPKLQLPELNGFVNITEQDSNNNLKPIFFSWQNDPEASSYRIRISPYQNLSSPIADTIIYNNYYQVIPSEIGLTNGRWYWGVTTTDIEGNTSSVSEIRAFTAVDGDIVFYTVFPPEGYGIADSRMFDIKFTWKNNIPGNFRFQIAKDKEFTNVMVDDIVEESTLSVSGKTLSIGDYYWRIGTIDAIAGTEPLYTEPKKFTVQPPLDPAIQIEPYKNQRFIVYPDKISRLEWEPVKFADYYQVELYQNGISEPIYSNTAVTDTVIELDLKAIPSGYYYWTIQAFSDETISCTRRTGMMAKAAFRLIQLRPIVLEKPTNNFHIAGLEAYYHPPSVSWHSPDPIRNGEAEFILTTNSKLIPPVYGAVNFNSPHIIFKQKNPSNHIQLPRLTEGTYYWTVTGITIDDLDVTPKNYFSFTVDPIPPLPAVTDMQPEDGTVFDETYLSNTLSLHFTWNKVPDAEAYLFTLFNITSTGQNNIILSKTLTADEDQNYIIDDISILDEGDFFWTVEPIRFTEDKQILQHGRKYNTAFTIKLPPIPEFEIENPGELYGN